MIMAVHAIRSITSSAFSHLGLMGRLALVVRVITQHHIQTVTDELGDTHKIVMPEYFMFLSFACLKD